MYILETAIKMSSHNEISNRQSFANEISMVEQVSIKIFQDLLYKDFSRIDRFLVIGVSADCGTEPGSDVGEDFMVCEGAPLDSLSECLSVFGDESRVGILFSD